jgi:GNAT superfamily N-acetyltransferase
MHVVRGGAADVPRLEPMWKAMLAHHQACAPSVASVVGFRDPDESWRIRSARYLDWLDEPDTVLFIAEDETGDAAGYAFTKVGEGEATLRTGARVGQLQALSVMPGARGTGLGSALIEAFLDHLRDLGVTEWSLGVLDGNSEARRLYERYGMRAYYVEMLGRVPEPPDAVERT